MNSTELIKERDAEIARLHELIEAVSNEATFTYHEAIKGRAQMPLPVHYCPVCAAPALDCDGVGVIACPRDPRKCYCQHVARTGDVCDICGRPEGAAEPWVYGPDRKPQSPWTTPS